jgi:hypothetical protein
MEGKETGEDGHPLVVKYKLTSGGSTVEELLMPGTDHEMVTMIHPDGADLLLTHYCMLGNQPQMRASAKPDSNKVEFKFVRATNMKSDKENAHARRDVYVCGQGHAEDRMDQL